MTVLFLILMVLSSAILGFIILIQNPKGGGLSGNVAGIGNQFMGVKQTTDVLEKGTWIFIAIIAILCITSSIFMGGTASVDNSTLKQVNPNQSTSAPAPKPAQPQPGQ